MNANRRLAGILRRTKACLCLLLVLNLQWMQAGCGSDVDPTRAMPGRRTIAIMPGSTLDQALAGTNAAGAKALDIDAAAGAFRIIDANGTSLISGRLDFVGDAPIVTEFVVHGDEKEVAIALDVSRRITSIRDGDDVWSRSDDKPVFAAGRQSHSLLDANKDLLALASDIDAGKFDPSADQLRLDPGIASMLSLISALLAPIGGVLQPLLIMFSIITGVESMEAEGPQVQMGVSGAYVIEHYLDPASPRRAMLSEFDTDRSVTLLGEPNAAPEHILLRSGSAVMHIVTDGMGSFAGVRSGATILVLDGTAEQLTAYFANINEGEFRTTGYLAYELIDVLAILSAEPRNGTASADGCAPPVEDVDTVAGFPIPAGSIFENIANDADLGGDASFCTQLSIYSAVLYALDRDGFINTPQQPQRELVGWGSVASEAGICGSLFATTQSCTEMMLLEEDLQADAASDEAVLKTTYDAVTALLDGLAPPVPERLKSSLEFMASQSQ